MTLLSHLESSVSIINIVNFAPLFDKLELPQWLAHNESKNEVSYAFIQAKKVVTTWSIYDNRLIDSDYLKRF